MKIATETAIRVHHLRSNDPSSLALAGSFASTIGTRAHAPAAALDGYDPPTGGSRLPGGAQVAGEEGDDLRPQLRRRRRAVTGPVVGEERMAGAVVDVHFDLPPAPADRRAARALPQLLA